MVRAATIQKETSRIHSSIDEKGCQRNIQVVRCGFACNSNPSEAKLRQENEEGQAKLGHTDAISKLSEGIAKCIVISF